MVIRINQGDLIKAVAQKHGIPVSRTRAIVKDLFGIIREEVTAGNEVTISCFGRFFKKHKKPHRVGNVAAGGTMCLPERDVPAFAPSDSFKDLVEDKHDKV